MLKDKPFQIAMIFSCLMHVVIFWQNPYFNNNLPKAIHELELTYLPIEKKADFIKEIPIKQETIKDKIEALQEKLPPPFIENLDAGNTDSLAKRMDLIPQKPQTTTQAIEIKKIVQSRLDPQEKIKSPGYLNYYQAIREKIRYRAYQNYTQTQEEGEIYLSFVILRNGTLKEVKIVDEKSSPNQYLKDVALKSMREASPYSLFPKDLDYPELSFNVIISFQITD